MFDKNKFYKEFSYGDLCGLEYLRDTLIKDMKEKIKEDNKKGNMYYTREEYIVNLFYSTLYLNFCMDMWETSKVKNEFKWEIYSNVRDLLFKELKLDTEDLIYWKE